MIRKLTEKDTEQICSIINRVALGDKGFIPDDCYHEPYMSQAELRIEMSRMKFYGWDLHGRLVAVAGFQPVEDVTLIRHVYVLPDYQHQGIGTRLCSYLKRLTRTKKLLVGAWVGAAWAISFYQRLGFRLVHNKDALLDRYWHVPPRQRDVSIVLGLEMKTQTR